MEAAHIEAVGAEVDHVLLLCVPQALPAVAEVEVEVLLARRDVAKGEQLLAEGGEGRHGIVGIGTELHDHVGAEEKRSVCYLSAIGVADQHN